MTVKRSSPPRSSQPSFSNTSVLLAGAVALLLYVCFLSHLGALGLVGPDEPRYVSIARSMSESGDWITPRLNGQPWFEKPTLYYWKAGAIFRIFGVSEITARLPAALSAVFVTLILAWAARRRFGSATALLALFILPTSIGMIAFARAATPDMLFTSCLAASMVAAAELLWTYASAKSRERILLRIAFGVMLGSAALAKGPAALALAGGSVALWTLLSRRWRDALRLIDPLAMTVFCVVALPWYILCTLRNPDFLRVFFFQHNFERYLTPLFHHQQPVWYFLGILALALLPWTLLLALVARDAIRTFRERAFAASPALFFASWAIFPLLFFSFSKSKLPGYILPAIPPLLLLLSRSAARAINERLPLARWLFAAVGATFPVLGFAMNHWLRRLSSAAGIFTTRQFFAWTLICAAGGLAIIALAISGRLREALLSSVLFAAILIELTGIAILPRLDPILSPRSAAANAAMLAPQSAVFAAYRLNRAWKYGLDFYLRRELPEWTAQTVRPCWIFTSAAGLADLQQRGLVLTSVSFGSEDAWLVILREDSLLDVKP